MFHAQAKRTICYTSEKKLRDSYKRVCAKTHEGHKKLPLTTFFISQSIYIFNSSINDKTTNTSP